MTKELNFKQELTGTLAELVDLAVLVGARQTEPTLRLNVKKFRMAILQVLIILLRLMPYQCCLTTNRNSILSR